MELIKLIAKHVKKRSLQCFVSFVSIFIMALYIILVKILSELQPFSKKLEYKNINSDWIWYFLWIGSIVLIFCIWVYYAPIVCDKFKQLKKAFCSIRYRYLYNSFRKWINLVSPSHIRNLGLFKLIYFLFWIIFYVAFIYFSWHTLIIVYTDIPAAVYTYIFLITLSTWLNYFSYYICIIYVYFLIKITKLEHDSHLKYVKSCPSLTPGMQTLINVSSTINIYFLLDSFLCTTAYFSFWKILLKNKQALEELNGFLFIAFTYVSIFMIMFGLISWIFIVLLSRVYIVRLHGLWKKRSLSKLNAKYQTTTDRAKKAVIENKLKESQPYGLTTGSAGGLDEPLRGIFRYRL